MPLYTGINTQKPYVCVHSYDSCMYLILFPSSLVHLLTCEDPDELEELSFTVSSSHFGVLQTIELEDGGTMKRVTMNNKDNFVHKMCQWYLTGNVPIPALYIQYTCAFTHTTLDHVYTHTCTHN